LFKFLRTNRTYQFRAVEADGAEHDFEIEASSPRTAFDLAYRFCAAKDWKLLAVSAGMRGK
jgi:hypothetical protein